MDTSYDKREPHVGATRVYFDNNTLAIVLSDGRELRLHLDKISWLSWLYEATPEQRTDWSLEPDGFAVYWNALDNGIEVDHVLSLHPIAS